MSRRIDLAVIGVVLLLLSAPAVGAIDGLSHIASDGVVYETNSGLEVELTEEREIEAAPFADDETFESENTTLSSPGNATASVSDDTFDGSSMTVTGLDASENPVTIGREDLSSDLTIAGGATGVELHDVELDNDQTDVEFTADSQTTLEFENVSDTGGIQVVRENGEILTGTTSTSDNTAQFEFEPGEYKLQLETGTSSLEIRDLETQELINETENGSAINVEVQLFGDEDTVREVNTTDGTIDWTGLPADERFALSIDAGAGYYERKIIIPSLVEQSTAYLLNASDPDVETVEPRFVLEDPTNQFDQEESELVFERPINTSDGTEYVAVTGDRIGFNGFDTILEEDQRYRVTVTDPESGSERRLGEYTASRSERVTLTVQDVEFDSVSDDEGIDWTARYSASDESTDEVEFIYRDDFETASIDYEIVERGNESNVLTDGSASGNLTVTEPVPPGEEDTVWIVKWESERANGDTFSGERPVSTSRLPVGPGLDSTWQTAFAMIGLFVVAGLFGAVNPGVGGIAVASTGGMFYLLGWLPDSTGGLMVGLALFIAVLAYTGRRARGAVT